MSVNEKRQSRNTSIPRAASSSESDREALDQRLQRLSDEVLPPVPYILTFPTKAPFHLGSRAADNWAVGHDRPFSAEEQQLQYMTFLTHHDTDSLLVAVGDWSDETGRMMADRSVAPSNSESSRDTGAKKKISLKDYKDQKTSGATASPMDSSAGSRDASGPTKLEETRQTTSSNLPKDVSKADSSQAPLKSHMRRSPTRVGQKRPSGSEREHLNPGNRHPETHSPKRPRLSPEKVTRRDPSPSKPRSPKLPALLSPTLPPTSTGPRLPQLLSPTLPPDIERELASLEDNSPPRTNRPNVADKTLPAKDASQRELTRDNAPNNPPKAQLITKLRYGRANRKRVEALLKFNGKRKIHRSASPISQDTDRDEVSRPKKGVDIGLSRVGSAKGKKQAADEPLGSQNGRARESKGILDKPRTPVPQQSQPPHSTTHEKSKTSSITPMKDLKPSSRRHDLAENDNKPVSHSANKRQSIDPGSIVKSSSAPTDARARHDRQAWLDEWQKFTEIGRELKHAAERYTNKHGASVADEKLAAVTAIEALLSFMLAFVAHDQARRIKRQVGDSSTWLSILAYWRAVKKNTAHIPALNNLCLLIGAVSFGTIHALDLERLAVIPVPGEHTPVPTPGSDGNAVLPDEKKNRKDLMELKTRLLDSYKDSQRLWLEGTCGLSEDVLERDFPSSWSRQSRNYSQRGRSPLRAGDYSGGYFLPFSGLTPPIELVRFSWVLLGEWCSKERVEWDGRLGL